ncbi:MAG: hypothetical protein PWQ88_910 [Candidatus Methanomethylophilaceae archaeon]|nr:hypothetical protein [Candidatus Methanomethylophilaceae archaeon]MDI3541962.1 hypothetical protein [Candidatus Methanomethylophilaceae archaeon]
MLDVQHRFLSLECKRLLQYKRIIKRMQETKVMIVRPLIHISTLSVFFKNTPIRILPPIIDYFDAPLVASSEYPTVAVYFAEENNIEELIASIRSVKRLCKPIIILVAPPLPDVEMERLGDAVPDIQVTWPARPETVASKIRDAAGLSEESTVSSNKRGRDFVMGGWVFDAKRGAITFEGALPAMPGGSQKTTSKIDDFVNVIQKDLAEQIMSALSCLKESVHQRRFYTELKIDHPDGGEIETIVKGICYCGKDNELELIEGVVYDSQEFKISRLDLMERYSPLLWLAYKGDDLVVVADQSGLLTYFNPAMESFLSKIEGLREPYNLNEIIAGPGKKFRDKDRALRHCKLHREYKFENGSRWIDWDVFALPIDKEAAAIVSHGRDISSCKNTIIELSEKQDRYEGLISSVPGVFFRCCMDQEWTMFYISDEIEELTGYSADEIQTNKVRSFNSIIHPDDRERVKNEILNAIDSAGKYTIRYRLLHRDGSTIWVQENGHSVVNGFLDGRLTDITEVKMMEEAYRLSEARYRSLFENMQTGFSEQEIVFDEEGRVSGLRFVAVNPAFETETGLSSDVIGKDLREVLPHFEDFWYDAFVETGLTGVRQRRCGYVEELKKWFDVHIFTPGPGRVAQIFMDMTEQKQMSALLKNSERRYRELFNVMPIGFVICRLQENDGKMGVEPIEMNPAMEKILSACHDCQKGTALFPTKDEWLQRWANLLSTGSPIEFEDSLPGSSRWVRIISFALNDDTFGSFFVDLSDRVMMEKSLQSALDEKNTLLREVNHRVGNNLQLLTSMLFLQRFKHESEASIESLVSVHNQLLAMIKAYQYAYRYEVNEDIELGQFIRELVEEILEGTDYTCVRTEVNDLRLPISTDALAQIGLVVNELISNAIKHAINKSGGHISFHLEQVDGTLEITYSDSGPGIDDLERFRNNPKHIGLRMVMAIVEKQLQGEISLQRSPWALKMKLRNLRHQISSLEN